MQSVQINDLKSVGLPYFVQLRLTTKQAIDDFMIEMDGIPGIIVTTIFDGAHAAAVDTIIWFLYGKKI